MNIESGWKKIFKIKEPEKKDIKTEKVKSIKVKCKFSV